MLVHRGKRGDPVLEPVERVAVEPQPCRHDAVHGGAHDAGENELELGLAVEPMAKTAKDYARYKQAAWKGLNERMLAAGAVLVLAFHPDIENSSGSKHLIDLARAAGIEVRSFRGSAETSTVE